MCPRSTERVPMEACVQSITPLRRPRNPCRLMLALRRTRPASGDDRCSSTRAAAPAVDIGAVAKERTRARRGRWAALRPRCADSFQPESTTGLRGDFCSDTERHTRRPHPLAGSARPPPPTLTKVTVPSSEEGSGLHGPFLPYSGRTSTGSWTAPGGAARPEDRALQRQAQRGATEAPCGLPGPPEHRRRVCTTTFQAGSGCCPQCSPDT